MPRAGRGGVAGVLVFLLLVAGSPAMAQTPATRGIAWLLAHQDPDGGFGASTGENRVLATSEAVLALRAEGMSASPQVHAAELFLSLTHPVSTDLMARRLLALRDGPLVDEAGMTALATRLTASGPGGPDAGLEPGWTATPNVLALSLLAVVPPDGASGLGSWVPRNGASAATVAFEGAGQALLSLARNDGFGLVDEASDPTTTGLAAEALEPFRRIPGFSAPTDAAIVAAILGHQRSGGDIGDGAQPVIDTAHGLLALVGLDPARFTQDLTTVGAAAQTYLEGAQANDGGWNASIYATALAVRALSSRRPDYAAPVDELGQTSIALSNPAPRAGQSVSATIQLKDASTVGAPATTMRLVATPDAGGAPLTLADVPVPPIAPGTTIEVTLTFATTGMSGAYHLAATADPDHLVAELSETNNTSVRAFEVISQIDLAISSTDIHFQDAGAGQVTVSATVHALGPAVSQTFDVAFYDGNPESGGTLVGTQPIAGVSAGGTATASAVWDASGVSGPTAVYVIVDPAAVVKEATRSDNQAFRMYFPGAGAPVSLQILRSDVVQTPNPIAPGDTADVRVRVHDIGTVDASRVEVAIEDVAGIVQEEQEIDHIAAGGFTDVHFAVQANHRETLEAVLDPDHRLNLVLSYDTSVSFDLMVSASARPIDLRLVWIQRQTAVGATGSIAAQAQQSGTQAVDTTVALFAGDARAGGAQELTRTQVHLAGAKNGGSLPVTVQFTGVKIGDGETFTACVDPDHVLHDPFPEDDCKSFTASKQIGNVAIDSRDIHVDPVGPDVGEPMTVSANIHELAGHDSAGLARLWQGRPEFRGSHILEQTRFHVGANATTQVAWRLLRPDGDPNLWVALVDVDPADAGEYGHLASDNYAVRNVYVKALIDTGRSYGPAHEVHPTEPVVGDVEETGHPAIVFGEKGDDGGHVTAVSLAPDGSWTELWSTIVVPPGLGSIVHAPALLDLTGDGHPNVVTIVHDMTSPQETRFDVVVLDGHGNEVWRKSLFKDPHQGGFPDVHRPAFVDLNGDGAPDVVTAIHDLVALDGKTGHELWRLPGAQFHIPDGAAIYMRAADIDGDGTPEIVISTGARNGFTASLSVLNSDGTVRWAGTPVNGVTSDQFGLADLDLDGQPDIVTTAYQGWVGAVNGVTGQQLWRQTYNADPNTVAVGDLRQDGLAYPVVGTLNAPSLAAFRPSSGYLWRTTRSNTAPGYRYFDPQVAMADLLSLGRPQIVAATNVGTFSLYDGRDGRPLLSTNDYRSGHYRAPPAIADADEDGHGDVLERDGRFNGIVGYNPNDDNQYPPSDVDVFSSVHWKEMPTVWNRAFYVKGEVDAHLHFLGNYQPWSTHDTWLDQFVSTPATLMADLTVGTHDISPTPAQPNAGDTTPVDVTVHNVGGVEATLVDVELWDGDPKAGGKRVGSATAPGPIAVRGGTETVTVPWKAYPEGEHHLYALVNPMHSVDESGYENNEASTIVLVAPGTQLADLAVSAADLAVSPAVPEAGAQVTVTATVHNVGVVSSGPFEVAWYDGVPAPGKAALAVAAAGDLAAGTQGTVTASLSLSAGSHAIYVVADDAQVVADGDRSNNVAWTDVDVSVPSLPELVASSLVAAPAEVVAGRSVALTATVTNLGAATPGPVVRFYLGNPTAGGVAIGETRIRGTLATGQAATAAATLDTHGLSGAQTVYAVADPDGLITETRKDDNTAQAAVTVDPDPVSLTVATDAPSYGADAAVAVTGTVAELSGVGRDVKVDLVVDRADGSYVATVAPGLDVVVAANESWPFTASWSTGSTPPGSYLLHAAARDATGVLAEASAPFVITPDVDVFARVTVDKTSYVPGDQAIIGLLVRNDSLNAPTQPLTETVTVHDGVTKLQTVRQVGPIALGASRQTVDLYQVSAFDAPETYAVDLTLTDSTGMVLGADHTTLVVSAPAPAQALKATVSAVPAEVGQGQPVTFTIDLTNTGNVPVTNEPVSVVVRDATTLAVQGGVGGTVSAAPGASSTVTLTWPGTATATVPLGDKVAVVEVQGSVVARTLLHVIKPVDTTPPSVTVTGIADGQVVRGPVTPQISATDQSAFTVTVTLDGLPYVVGTPITAEGAHVLVVDAVDIFGNRTTVTIGFAIDDTPPVTNIAGIADGTVTAAPSVTLTSTASDLHLDAAHLSVNGTSVRDATGLAGASFTDTRTISAEGAYQVRLTATDLAGNGAESDLSFAIDRTPPVVSLTGATDGEVTNASNVVIHAAASDLHLAHVEVLLDGQTVAAGIGLAGSTFAHDVPVTDEADHEVTIVATDLAGNTARADLSFAIDRTPPAITVTGIPGRYTNQDVTPVVTVTDAHPGTTTITMNGQPFTSGATVSAEGDYTLDVAAVDAAGNRSTDTEVFTIDKTPPVVTVTGVSEGQLSFNPVTPVFTATDAHLDPTSVAATLNGAPFTSGTQVTADDTYTLIVHAADLAGNVTMVTVHFEVFEVQVTLDSEVRVANVLVLAPAAHCQPVVMPAKLAAALSQDGLQATVVGTREKFRNAMRTGLYDVYVLYRSESGEGPEEELGGELTEQVRGGAGLIVVNATPPDDDPGLTEALGAKVLGRVHDDGHEHGCVPAPGAGGGHGGLGGSRPGEDGGRHDDLDPWHGHCHGHPHLPGSFTMTVAVSPLGPATTLTVTGPAAGQRTIDATSVGTVNGQTLLSIHVFGAGHASLLTFDPEATPSPDMQVLLERVLAWAAPAALPARVPLDGVIVDHTVTNTGPARDYELSQTYPTAVTVLDAPGAVGTTPEIDWLLTMVSGDTALRYAAMRLPDAAGPSVFDAELDVSHPTRGPLPVASSTVSVTVPVTRADLEAQATAAVNALPPGRHVRQARHALAHAIARGSDTRWAASEAIEEQLECVEALHDIGPSADPARDAVDALLRAYETHWSADPAPPPEPGEPGSGHDDCNQNGGEGHHG